MVIFITLISYFKIFKNKINFIITNYQDISIFSKNNIANIL